MCITACHSIGTGLESEFENSQVKHIYFMLCKLMYPALFFAPWTTTYLEFVISCGSRPSPHRVVRHESWCLPDFSYKSFEKRTWFLLDETRHFLKNHLCQWIDNLVNKLSKCSDYHLCSYRTPELYQLVSFVFALLPCVYICLCFYALCSYLHI